MKRLFFALLALGLALGKLSAQRASTLKALRQEIEVAQEKGHTKTQASKAAAYLNLALRHKRSDDAIWAIYASPRTGDGEQGALLLRRLYELRQAKWLTPGDKLLIDWSIFRELCYHYPHVEERPKPQVIDPTKPWLWERKDFDPQLNLYIDRITSNKAGLHTSVARYPLSLRREDNTETLLIPIVREYWRYGSEKLAKRIKDWLIRELPNLKNPAERIAVEWMRIERSSLFEEGRDQARVALEQRYRGERVLRPYILQIVSAYVRQKGTRSAVDLLKQYPYPTKETQDYLKQLLAPELDFWKLPEYIIGKRGGQYSIRTQHLKYADIAIYRTPHIIAPGESWQPSQSDRPVYTERITLNDNPIWDATTDTLQLPPLEPGRYEFRLTSTPRERASEQRSDTLLRSFYVSDIFLEHEYPSSQAKQALRLIHAQTGAPLANKVVRLYQRKHDQDKLEMETYRSNALGLVTLPGASYSYLQVVDEADPLGGEIDYYYYLEGWPPPLPPHDKVALYTDRSSYRPGHRVHVYGIHYHLGRHLEEHYIKRGRSIQLQILDDQGQPLKTDTVGTDRWGRFDYTYQLAQDASPGYYRLTCQVLKQDKGEQAGEQETDSPEHPSLDLDGSHYFSVGEYKLDAYELIFAHRDEHYFWGDTLVLQGQLLHLGGGSVAGAKVSVHIKSGDSAIDPRAIPQEDLQNYNLTTDAEGRVELRLPLLKDPGEDDRIWFTYQASAVTPSGENLTAQGGCYIRGRWYIFYSEIPPFIERRERPNFEISTSDHLPYKLRYRIHRGGQTITEGISKVGTEIPFGDWLATAPTGRYELSYELLLDGVDERQRPRKSESFTLYDIREGRLDMDSTAIALLGTEDSYETGSIPEIYVATCLQDSYIYYHVIADDKGLAEGVLRPKAGVLTPLKFAPPQDIREEIKVTLYTIQGGEYHRTEKTYKRRQPNKELTFRWSSWRERLRAGSHETWTVQVLHQGKPVQAALLSWMYNAANDFLRPKQAGAPPTDNYSRLHGNSYILKLRLPERNHRLMMRALSSEEVQPASKAEVAMEVPDGLGYATDELYEAAEQSYSAPMLSGLRRYFDETAYVRPRLTTDAKGYASWSFTVPDAISRWRVELLAHTADFKVGYFRDYVETFRELQVEPNLPRFLRLGDSIVIRSNVRNLSDSIASGQLTLELFDPSSGERIQQSSLPFSVAKGQAETLQFPAQLRDYQRDSIGLRIYAQTPTYRDGEEHRLPVLTATEEVVRGAAFTLTDSTRQSFDLRPRLFPSTDYIPAKGELTLSLEASPLYQGLLCLPQLGLVESDNAISLTNALYSLSLAQHIARIPGLRDYIQRRGQGDKLGEQLAGYLDPKQSTKRFSLYLDKLAQLQNSSGLWSWYPQMDGSLYLNYYIIEQLQRCRALQALSDEQATRLDSLNRRAWEAMHREMAEAIQQIQATERKEDKPLRTLPSFGMEYLYLLTSAPEERHRAEVQVAFIEPRLRAQVFKQPFEDIARTALIYQERDPQLAEELRETLRQNLVADDQGMRFPETNYWFWWYNRRFERLALTIRALQASRRTEDSERIREIQRWVLGQKRTTNWGNTLHSAEAIYLLTLGAPSELPLGQKADMTLHLSGGTTVRFPAVEQLSKTLLFNERSAPSELSIQPSSTQPLWAGVTARYSLPISMDKPSGREMRLVRRHYTERVSEGKVVLLPLDEGTELRVGDKLVTVLTLTIDRAFDFVTLRDPRLGCAEPTEQLPSYRWGAGTSYRYEPRDRWTNFYLHHLNPGTYELRYEQHVVRSGRYQAAGAQLQCSYAPEYTASTGYGGSVEVQP